MIEKINLHLYLGDYSNWVDDDGEPDWDSALELFGQLWKQRVSEAFPECDEISVEIHRGEGGYGNTPNIEIYRTGVDSYESYENDSPSTSKNGVEIQTINEIYKTIYEDAQEQWYVQLDKNDDD